MKSIFTHLTILGFVASKSERYIIEYDDLAWNTLSLAYLPTNTVYTLKELKMQVADLDMDEIREFETIPGVTLRKDSEVRIAVQESSIQKDPKNWGLDRIDQRQLPLDKLYHYDTQGEGVDAYIIDTGVYPDHVEFEGRATFDKNFSGDGKDEDCHGHGTHVSSTIGGVNVGVAKKVRIHGLKSLNCGGSGAASNSIAAINHVVTEHKKAPGRKSVINMSIGGYDADAFNKAIQIATKEGVTVVVAASNFASDACQTGPAAAPDAIAVAASDINDGHASFSNYGKCVALYAPGVDVYAAVIGRKDAYGTKSGTSMSSPHTAGVAALLLGSGKATTPKEVRDLLVANGTKDVVKKVPAQTPNVLLYSLGVNMAATYPTAEVMNLVK